ncbi:MAG: hypothetical protein H7Y59_09595 [Anaerolineales bacterium]|nr:hypothetical protein [Anaerolineales bacterium]
MVKKQPENRDEHTLQAHLVEYQFLREEVITQITLQNQLAGYAIFIIAGTSSLFAIGSPSIAIQQPFLLLIASMLMSAITWASIDASFHANDMGKYIDSVLAPKIHRIIGDPENDEYKVFRWESTRIYHPIRLITKGIMGSGKFAVSYIPSVAFVFAFYITATSLKSLGLIEQLLFWLSIIMVLVTPIAGIMNLAFILGMGKPQFTTSITTKKVTKKKITKVQNAL